MQAKSFATVLFSLVASEVSVCSAVQAPCVKGGKKTTTTKKSLSDSDKSLSDVGLHH